MDPTNFLTNPGAEIMAAYTDVLGVYVYAFLMIIIGGYVLMKTESWAAATAVFIFGAILFAAVLPAIVIILIATCAALVFAAILIDVFVLK